MTLVATNIPIMDKQHGDAISLCEESIRLFLFRHINHWTGLSANCKKSEIIAVFPFIEGEGATHSGTKNIEYHFRALPFEGFTDSVFFNFFLGQLSHITTNFWSFDRRECADILRHLGKPAEHLNFAWKQKMIAGGELIYPDKGIAIGIIPTTGLIAAVTVFPPCTTNVYKENYWNTRLAREF